MRAITIEPTHGERFSFVGEHIASGHHESTIEGYDSSIYECAALYVSTTGHLVCFTRFEHPEGQEDRSRILIIASWSELAQQLDNKGLFIELSQNCREIMRVPIC